jgi:hypothetical protein
MLNRHQYGTRTATSERLTNPLSPGPGRRYPDCVFVALSAPRSLSFRARRLRARG